MYNAGGVRERDSVVENVFTIVDVDYMSVWNKGMWYTAWMSMYTAGSATEKDSAMENLVMVVYIDYGGIVGGNLIHNVYEVDVDVDHWRWRWSRLEDM